ARVRNQSEILGTLMQLRPEQLAQLIQSNDLDSFEELTHFGSERSRKILDALRDSVDPLALEITAIEDRIAIELNVATVGQPHFKDASDLSRGQKCTALLPILLARRENPLIIDQPEDNLDNHFIFETVVNSVLRMKKRRQMIFITHNANIPVLAEAELVLVMTSDGRVGAIEKRGTVDECREQIIELLEGGREAFALRSKRYAGGWTFAREAPAARRGGPARGPKGVSTAFRFRQFGSRTISRTDIVSGGRSVAAPCRQRVTQQPGQGARRPLPHRVARNRNGRVRKTRHGRRS